MLGSNIVIKNRQDCKDCMHRPVCGAVPIFTKLVNDLQEIIINPDYAGILSVNIVCKHLNVSKHLNGAIPRTFTEDS
jgi:hypothetical protein